MADKELQLFLKGELQQRQARRRKKPSHNEDNLQIACVKWFDLQYPTLATLLFHAANGGSRNAIEGAKFKRMGVRRGVADIIFLLPNKSYPYLVIELKDRNKGRQSREQKEWQKQVEKAGGKYAVARTVEDFMTTINEYMNN